MFRFLFIVLLSSSIASAALDEAREAFAVGKYDAVHQTLKKPASAADHRAQLYLLATQFFDNRHPSAPTKEALKMHIAQVRGDKSHEDYLAANLAWAFWNIYSEDAELPHIDQQPIFDPEMQRLVPGDLTHYGSAASSIVGASLDATDTDGAGFDAMERGEAGLGVSYRAPLERVNIDAVEAVINNSEYFPIRDLFEGQPSVAEGLRVLSLMGKEGIHHGLYFLGSYTYGAGDERERKAAGLGYITSAAHLKNATAEDLLLKLLDKQKEPGWLHNCKIWCLWGPTRAKRLTCGASDDKKWWLCGLGLCGYATRWSANQLCFNIRGLSREAVGAVGFVAGLGLLFTQRLDQDGIIDVPENWDSFLGWLGIALTSGGGGVVITKKKAE